MTSEAGRSWRRRFSLLQVLCWGYLELWQPNSSALGLKAFALVKRRCGSHVLTSRPVTRIRNLSIDLTRNAGDAELARSLHEAHRDARVQYERLRLTAVSRDIQESGRHALRYAYGLLRQAEGNPPREDERARGPLMMLHDSLMALYAQVRRELGVPRADEVYREPEEWLGAPHLAPPAASA